jgi:hypothetical protein
MQAITSEVHAPAQLLVFMTAESGAHGWYKYVMN